MTKPVNEVVVIFVTNKSLNNGDVIPVTEIFRYDISDDGKDIINYIENYRKSTGVDGCGRLDHDEKYVWDRFKSDVLKIGDPVYVCEDKHPLNAKFGEIKRIDNGVCLVFIEGYVFNIPIQYLVKA